MYSLIVSKKHLFTLYSYLVITEARVVAYEDPFSEDSSVWT